MAFTIASGAGTGIYTAETYTQATGTAATYTLSVTAGELIIVAFCAKDRSSWAVPTVTDSAGNTYTEIESIAHSMGGLTVDGCALYRAIAGTSVTLTITATSSSSVYGTISAVKITGHNASSIVAAAYTGEVTSYNITSLTVTASASNPGDALAIAVMSSSISANTPIVTAAGGTVGTYTTLAAPESTNSGTYTGFHFAYQVLGSPASQAIQYTIPSPNEGSSGILIFINPAASGATNDIEGEATLPSVGTVYRTPSALQMTDAGSQTLTVFVNDQYETDLPNAEVSVIASPAGVVTVGTVANTDATGTTTALITAVANGNATLAVTSGGVSGEPVSVTVSGGGGAVPLIIRRI